MEFIHSSFILVLLLSFIVNCSRSELKMGNKKKGGSVRGRITTTTASPDRTSSNGSISTMVDNLGKFYDRNQPPQIDRPTEVQLGIYIISFFSISEQTMDYSLSMYFRQAWRDPRLEFKPINGKIDIRLPDGSWNKFWVPDTFFRNEKRASFHKVTVANRRLSVNATGHLWYATRITATLSCPMKLQKFPFDSQMCPIQFESFGYTMDTMYFGWVDNPVQHEEELQLPQFTMINKLQYDCSANYTSGMFPCAEIRFILRRDIGYFIIQIFVPSILTVILSWVSFWINIDGVPARVSLGLLTVLTITTQSTSINTTLPKVSYIKAIDIWMISCLVFVFCALLEYAFVNVAARNGVRIRTPIVRQAMMQEAIDMDIPMEQVHGNREPSVLPGCWMRIQEHIMSRRNFTSTVDVEGSKRRARNIDKFSRKTFPLAFLIFNIIYWISASFPASTELALAE